MAETSKDKQLIINVIASLLTCLISTGISFVLNPIIIENMGFEGSSYLELANQFVSYAAIAATALNTMGGRFITIKLHQNDKEGANEYFNSILFGNIGIVAFLTVPLFFVIMYLDRLIDIEPAIAGDVKILFAATFLNFLVTIVSTTFSTATFATNRLDLTALRTIESQILRGVLLVLAFTFLDIHLFYVGIATLAATIYLFLFYIHYTKKLLPQITISRKYFRLPRVLEILASGIWNTIMRTGQVLTNNLDSLIAKTMISGTAFGHVGTSKIIVNAINTLYEAVSAVFMPSLTISYAKSNKEELISDLNSAMKLTGFFANIPLAFMIAFGMDFYTLWLARAQTTTSPEDIRIVYILSVLAMLGTIVGGAISPLFNVYTVVNKLKWNSLVTLFMGILSTGIVFVFLLASNDRSAFGPYIIVGTSTFLGIIKNMTFTPMYAAHCLGIKKTSFYPTIVRYIIVSVGMIGLFCVYRSFITTPSWFVLFADIFLCGISGCVLNFLFLFGKKEKELLLHSLKRFLKRSK